MKKDDIIKEQFKQALISTIKVISDEYKKDVKVKDNLSSKNFNFFELDNLNVKHDFVKLRAAGDSEALKRNFVIKKFTKIINLKKIQQNHYMIYQKK